MRQRYIYILLLLLGCSTPLLSQEANVEPRLPDAPTERKAFDRKTWRKATRGLDYTVNKRRQQPANPEKPKEEKSKNENSRTLFIILGVILIAAIIALLIAAITGHLGPKNKKVRGMQVSVEDIEANIFESDLQGYIRQALEAENYRRAIRLYFLEILKELALQKKIKWKKEKTNRIYFYELQASGMAKEFDRLSLIFDRVRYGQTPISASDFEAVAPEFKAFLRKLNPAKI
jgi:hypothetical protein